VVIKIFHFNFVEVVVAVDCLHVEPESKKGKEPRNQVPRKVSICEEGFKGFPA
jgi:hypothetical protein